MCAHKSVRILELKNWLRPFIQKMKKIGRSPAQFRIYHKKILLAEDKTLEYLRIPNDAKLNLSIRTHVSPKDLLREKFSGSPKKSHLLITDDFNGSFTIPNLNLSKDNLQSLAEKICELKNWHAKDFEIFSEFMN